MVRRCVWSRNLKNEEAKARARPLIHKKKKKKIEHCYAMPFSLLFELSRSLCSDFHASLMYRFTCITVRRRFHFQQTFLRAISGSHSGVAEHSNRLRCHAVLSGIYLSMFQNITVTSLSASARPWKSGISIKPDGWKQHKKIWIFKPSFHFVLLSLL